MSHHHLQLFFLQFLAAHVNDILYYSMYLGWVLGMLRYFKNSTENMYIMYFFLLKIHNFWKTQKAKRAELMEEISSGTKLYCRLHLSEALW